MLATVQTQRSELQVVHIEHIQTVSVSFTSLQTGRLCDIAVSGNVEIEQMD